MAAITENATTTATTTNQIVAHPPPTAAEEEADDASTSSSSRRLPPFLAQPPKLSPAELVRWAATPEERLASGIGAPAALLAAQQRLGLSRSGLDTYNPIRPKGHRSHQPTKFCLTCLEQRSGSRRVGEMVGVADRGRHLCQFVDVQSDLIDANPPGLPAYLRQPPLHRGRRPGHLTSSRHTPIYPNAAAVSVQGSSSGGRRSSKGGAGVGGARLSPGFAPATSPSGATGGAAAGAASAAGGGSGATRWLVSAKPWLSRYAPSAAPSQNAVGGEV